MTQTRAEALTLEISLTDPPIPVRVDTVLLGRTFTHVLTDAEIARDVLPMTPDFAAIWPLVAIPPYDTLSGLPCDDVFDDEREEAVLRLPPGTLADYSADDLIGIRVADDGLYLGASPSPNEIEHMMLTTAFSSAARTIFDMAAQFADDDWDDDPQDPPSSVALEEFLLLGCLRHPEVFTNSSLPVTELLTDLGLDHDHGQIALEGFDFEAEEEALAETQEFERITETYELSDDEAEAVIAITDKVGEFDDAVHEWIDSGKPEEEFPDIDLTELAVYLSSLAEPMVAVAISDETLTGDPHLGLMLRTILETVQPYVPRRAQAGWQWLVARCADAMSEFDKAESGYRRALELDADFYPAMRELATLATLRGDAEKAVSLMVRAGVPADDNELQMATRYLGESRTDLSRNGPCWCGSGKKYKKCHLGKSDFDLAARLDWLYQKVSAWVHHGGGRLPLIALAAATVDPDDPPEAMLEAVLNPLLTDVLIFEGGFLDIFIETRAALLPVDEQELLTRWKDSQRALYSVETVDSGPTLALKDLVTGVVAAVPAGTVNVSPGDLVCIRLLPAGDRIAAPGGVVMVSPEHRELTLAMLALQDTEDADPIRTVSVLTGGRTID